jgi:hypothetical protein
MLAADAPALWLPPPAELSRPAIIRPAEHALLKPGAFRPMTAAERDATIAELVRSKRLTAGEAQRAMFLTPMLGAYPPAVTLTYLNSASNTANATTYDFGNFTAARNGLMIVGVGGGNSSAISISSISIGGTSLTPLTAGTFQRCTAIAALMVTAGAIDVQATFSSTSVRAVAFVWLLTGMRSSAPTFAASNGSNSNVTSISASLQLIKAGGIAVYVIHHNGTGTVSWGAATERDDFAVEATSAFAGADKSESEDTIWDSEIASFASATCGISAASFR